MTIYPQSIFKSDKYINKTTYRYYVIFLELIRVTCKHGCNANVKQEDQCFQLLVNYGQESWLVTFKFSIHNLLFIFRFASDNYINKTTYRYYVIFHELICVTCKHSCKDNGKQQGECFQFLVNYGQESWLVTIKI